MKRVALAVLGMGLAWLVAARVTRQTWAPALRTPRPDQCGPGPHQVHLTLPWTSGGGGQTESALSDDGCLRLRADMLLTLHRRWQVLELQPDGSERVLFEAEFGWRPTGVGFARVLDSPYEPEPLPVDWQDRGFNRLTWFSPTGRTVHTFDPSSRSVTEERVSAGRVERRTVQLPEHNQELNRDAPAKNFPEY